MKCEKCGRDMTLVLVEKGSSAETKIWKCTNLRCLYMCQEVTLK
ncbi:hypothetical protein [Clostridium botulinum]|nr:hypothetical protein [Clostridium botulinum]